MAMAPASALPASPMRNLAARQSRNSQNLLPHAAVRPREVGVMFDPCCGGNVGSLLLQINVICLLLAAIGATAIVKHASWSDGVHPVAELFVTR